MPMTREPLDLRGINFEEGYIAVLDKPLRWTCLLYTSDAADE